MTFGGFFWKFNKMKDYSKTLQRNIQSKDSNLIAIHSVFEIYFGLVGSRGEKTLVKFVF